MGYSIDNISIETIIFIDMLNTLSDMFKKGIKDFSEYYPGNNDNFEGILYDGRMPVEEADNYSAYQIISDRCINEDHHDIIGLWSDKFDGVDIHLWLASDDEYILIEAEKLKIIIDENGWSCA